MRRFLLVPAICDEFRCSERKGSLESRVFGGAARGNRSAGLAACRTRPQPDFECCERWYQIPMTDLNTILAAGGIPPEARIVDQPRIEAAVREILLSVGEDPDRDGLRETPARVARMYAEIFGGLHVEPGRHLQKVFEEQYDEMVLVRDISFNSMCEHHLLPFMGKAHVGYIPRGRVTGLSKLARVVDEIARRPQVQERMTHMIADLIENELTPSGVIVVVEAEHTCMTIRGVKKPGALTVTSAVRGMFRNNLASRAEAMALINGK